MLPKNRFIDLKGKKFGEWRVLDYAGNSRFNCRCKCGIVKEVTSSNLRKGMSKSCCSCSPKLNVHRNIKLSSYRSGKSFEIGKLSDLKKLLGFDQLDIIHMYPVIKGERFKHKGICLAEHTNKDYSIFEPPNKIYKLKNWILFCERRGLSTKLFYKVLRGELLHHRGFCLSKNRKKLPKLAKKIYSFKKGGEIFKTESISEFSKEIGVGKKNMYSLASGKTTCSHDGWTLDGVECVFKHKSKY